MLQWLTVVETPLSSESPQTLQDLRLKDQGDLEAVFAEEEKSPSTRRLAHELESEKGVLYYGWM